MEASEKLVNGSNTLENLPSEIILEILLNLPVKSLLKFRCVCKTWLSLISSSHFVKTHLKISRNSKNYANHRVIFSLCEEPYTKFICSLSSILDNTATLNFKGLYYPSSIPRSPGIYGNCNGLLCVPGGNYAVVLYNPTTRKSKILSHSGIRQSTCFYTYGLCYHESDDDYRVVELSDYFRPPRLEIEFYEPYVTEIKVYSLRTNSWRKINDQAPAPKPLFTTHPGLPVGGVLYWVIHNTIFEVDTVTDRYGQLAGPRYVDKSWGIMDFGGCLGVYQEFDKTAVDIWILKESWTKVFTMPYHVNPMGFDWLRVGLMGGEILLCNIEGGNSVVYKSREGSFIYHVINDLYVPRFNPSPVYIESLVAPSFDGE